MSDKAADVTANNSESTCPPQLAGHRFKPGRSGNPKGRPRGAFSLAAALKEKLKQKVPGNKDGYTWGQLLVERTLVLGAKGNSTALKEVWGRVEDTEVRGPSNWEPPGRSWSRWLWSLPGT